MPERKGQKRTEALRQRSGLSALQRAALSGDDDEELAMLHGQD
jgi:hypothetical protein